MRKLNDTQLILLSTAMQRTSGSLYPLPDTITGDHKRKANAIDTLLKRGLAQEHETRDQPSIYRTDGDIGFGVFLTDAGRTAIDAGEGGVTVLHPQRSRQHPASPRPRWSTTCCVARMVQRCPS